MTDEKCILDPQRDCLGLIKARELEKDLNELKGDVSELRRQNSSGHERMFERLNDLEKQTDKLEIHYTNIQETLTNIKVSIDLLSKRLGDIEMRPGKRWESIVGQLIGIVVAAVAAFMLGKFGLG